MLNGKTVLAPPKDIAEVKNAYGIYERLDELDPYSADDLLLAHGIMTRGLVEESGMFRTRPVGVVDNEGRVLHFGTLPQYGTVDKVSLRSALPTKKDALWRHPACFIIRFRFNAVADKRQ